MVGTQASEPISQEILTVFTVTDSSRYSTASSQDELLARLSDFQMKEPVGHVPSYLMDGHRQNREFFGRQDILEQIDGIFLDDAGRVIQNEVKRLVLCGMGGVGKTEVAIEYAFSRREKYDAIFWVDAETVQKLNASYARIARELDLQGSSKLHDDTTNRKLVQTWLTKPLITPNGQRLDARKLASWLLIFDHVDDPKILNDYWPVNGGREV